ADRTDQRLAKRLLTPPLAPCQDLVDDDDAGRVVGVTRVEEPAFRERHAKGAKISVVGGLVLRLALVAGARSRAPLNEERPAPGRFERQEIAGAGKDDSGLHVEIREQPIVKGPNTAAIVNAGLRRSSRHPKRTSWRIVSMPGLDG